MNGKKFAEKVKNNEQKSNERATGETPRSDGITKSDGQNALSARVRGVREVQDDGGGAGSNKSNGAGTSGKTLDGGVSSQSSGNNKEITDNFLEKVSNKDGEINHETIKEVAEMSKHPLLSEQKREQIARNYRIADRREKKHYGKMPE